LDNQIKTIWNIIKHKTGKLYLTEQIPFLLIKDPEELLMPSVLFFLTFTENLNLHQEVRGDAISFLKETFSRKFPHIKTISTTETEIKSIIHSLKAKIRQVMIE
jgi:hypothetical protein